MSSVSPQPWTVQWLINTFLFGISLTDDTNTPFPDSIFIEGLGNAKQFMADRLDICVDRQAYTERHDLSRSTAGEWFMIRLGKRPVHSIQKVQLMVGASPVPVDIPLSWVQQFDADGGIFWLVPTADDIQNLHAMQYSILSARQWAAWGNLPGFISVEYNVGYDLPFEIIADPEFGTWTPPSTQSICGRLKIRIQTQSGATPPSRTFTITGTNITTGLADTETVTVASGSSTWSTKGWTAITSVTWDTCEGDILFTGNFRDNTNNAVYKPMDYALLEIGGKVASFSILNPAGDLIAGAGIASKSQSVGGVSQSVSTTSSATNSGYGARIIQYRQDIEKDLPMIRRRFHGIPMIAG